MIIPFINFTGQANEAITFYENVFEVTNKRVVFFKDMPDDMKANFPKEADYFVMHSEMNINGTTVWIGDTLQGLAPGDMVTLSVPFSSIDEVRKVFDKLKIDGKVHMGLAQTFYSPLFGTVQDKFGVIWHLICQ